MLLKAPRVTPGYFDFLFPLPGGLGVGVTGGVTVELDFLTAFFTGLSFLLFFAIHVCFRFYLQFFRHISSSDLPRHNSDQPKNECSDP